MVKNRLKKRGVDRLFVHNSVMKKEGGLKPALLFPTRIAKKPLVQAFEKKVIWLCLFNVRFFFNQNMAQIQQQHGQEPVFTSS